MGKQFTHYAKGTLSSHIDSKSMAIVIPAAYGANSAEYREGMLKKQVVNW
jgi:hypothetical protein